jgi:hypothetical protein
MLFSAMKMDRYESLSVPQSCLLCLKMAACKVVFCNFLVIKINIIFLLQ